MQNIKKTCLHEEHLALNAKMNEFAGYDMPIVYDSIKAEHLAVREKVGMFDVSHMGEFLVKGNDAQKFIDKIFCNDIVDKESGQVTYGMMLYENGTIVDDLLVYKYDEFKFLLVVNASNIAKDYAWVVECSDGFDVTVNNLSDEFSEIAVQGPLAETTLIKCLGLDLQSLAFFHFKHFDYQGEDLLISRTGYTGEDGFEIYANATIIKKLWSLFLKNDIKPCGLGARDTLRFEAALPLYGHEISDKITPLEAGLKFFTKLKAENDFIGRAALEAQEEAGLKNKLVGIELTKLSIPREGYKVFHGETEIGYITTGYLSISLDKPIAMALVRSEFAKKGTEIFVQVRNKMIPGITRDKKFLKKNYKS